MVSDNQPVSTGNLKSLYDNGMMGGVVIYEDDTLPTFGSGSNPGAVTLSRPVTDFARIEIYIVGANSGMAGVSYGSRTCVVETRLFAEDSPGGIDVYLPGLVSTQAKISGDGTKLTITNIGYARISRVIGIN